MAASINGRVGAVDRILRAAAAADTDAAELVARAEQRRLTGSRGPADYLDALGLLRPELTTKRAAAQIYVLTGPGIFEQFTVTCGWSTQEYRQWLAQVLVAALLQPIEPNSQPHE